MFTDFEFLPSSPFAGLCSVAVFILSLLALPVFVFLEDLHPALSECLDSSCREQWLLSLPGTLPLVERRFPY